MTRQDVGSLALRIVGLYALIIAIGMLMPGVIGLVMWIKMALIDGADAATASRGEIFHAVDFVVLSGPAAFLLIGAALFFRGRRLSAFWNRMDRRDIAGAAAEPFGPVSS